MKIQYIAVIFVIIMIPISFTISAYIGTQIDTIVVQTRYDTKLNGATYDAVRAFQINTINNEYSTISDSKIRDIEAAINTFYHVLGTNLGADGLDQETLKQYIPAILFTLYDGYYIYGKYKNTETNEYDYGLRSYIYYSCRYKKGSDYDFVVNYTLDNAITIYGLVNGEYVTKSGYLIGGSVQQSGNNVIYNDVIIEPEILTQTLLTTDDNVPKKYNYVNFQNKRVYQDGDQYFWYDNYQKTIVTDEATLEYVRNTGMKSDSAVNYYKEASIFSNWVKENLGNIRQSDAELVELKDSDGNLIELSTTLDPEERIFDVGVKNDPMIPGSPFYEHRMAVIRRSIESSLISAIANYNRISGINYEFVLPVMQDTDWDKILNNISMVTFLQGLPIGNKYYNNYCVITNNKNKEVVSDNAIFVLTSDGEYHQVGCKDIVDNRQGDIIGAYRNIDFQRKNVKLSEEDIRFFYPQDSHAAYDCVVNISDTYSISDIVKGQFDVKSWNGSTIKRHTPDTLQIIRKTYLQAIARERYDLYKTNGYFGVE